jgi:phage gp46-like protein
MSHTLQIKFGDQTSATAMSWGACDLAFEGHDIETAVIASLFTWRRARPEDRSSEPYGWWAEDFGSRLYLLQRRTMTAGLEDEARGYIEEALQWLVDQSVVSSIAVRTEMYRDTGHLYAQIAIARDDGESLSLVWQNLFDHLR